MARATALKEITLPRPRHRAGFFVAVDCSSWRNIATHNYVTGVSFGHRLCENPDIDICASVNHLQASSNRRVPGELVIHERNQLPCLVTELPLHFTTLFGYERGNAPLVSLARRHRRTFATRWWEDPCRPPVSARLHASGTIWGPASQPACRRKSRHSGQISSTSLAMIPK
jgi:hypothetical protein